MNSIKTFFEVMIATIVGVMAIPVAKPAANTVAAVYSAYATQLPVTAKDADGGNGSADSTAAGSTTVEITQPTAEVDVTAEVTQNTSPMPPDMPSNHHGCCPDCKCGENCQCEYPGQCLLRAAGKHMIWIHDPVTKSWRGYASPHCRDVREVWEEQNKLRLRKVITTPPADSQSQPRLFFRGGGCANGRCGV